MEAWFQTFPGGMSHRESNIFIVSLFAILTLLLGRPTKSNKVYASISTGLPLRGLPKKSVNTGKALMMMQWVALCNMEWRKSTANDWKKIGWTLQSRIKETYTYIHTHARARVQC